MKRMIVNRPHDFAGQLGNSRGEGLEERSNESRDARQERETTERACSVT